MLQNVHVPGRSIATDSASKSRIVMKCSCHIRLENVQESFIIDSHDIIIKVSDLPGRKESRIRVLSSATTGALESVAGRWAPLECLIQSAFPELECSSHICI